jgi:hypothetical protein
MSRISFLASRLSIHASRLTDWFLAESAEKQLRVDSGKLRENAYDGTFDSRFTIHVLRIGFSWKARKTRKNSCGLTAASYEKMHTMVLSTHASRFTFHGLVSRGKRGRRGKTAAG